MEQISTSPKNFCLPQTPSSLLLCPSILSFRSFHRRRNSSFHGRLFCALEAGPNSARVGSQEALDPDLLRKPIISPLVSAGKELEKEVEVVTVAEGTGGGRKYESGGEREIRLDWEDQILEDTVPLVGFVRMILHSGKYGSGDRLSPEHEKTILERLLPYHPEFEKKIGCGVDHITIGYHPQFEDSRCLFIVRKDGELVDFSYWKCIKGLVRKKYPLYADSFILRHFRRRRRYD
ncbi:hypothetical protein Nepgr_015656 [Nepenthes gracilis]|uniref:Protein DCL, chloroplastic n=1 Tax=Nepenthes gracilis TaxID=150966 RepID=A0AAD3XRS7_NEPGR|nr:hypothetical protein Nepgr_015656 [Nepenthes gracilis]